MLYGFAGTITGLIIFVMIWCGAKVIEKTSLFKAVFKKYD
jgi:hypothetical protein